MPNTQIPHRDPSTSVSSCVSSILEAFSNSLDIFKRLRERHRNRKGRKSGKKGGSSASTAETQLNDSLSKAPEDIRQEYSRNYDKSGERFAKGDTPSQVALTETLLKLNTGLVSIIATFLDHKNPSGTHLALDFKALTMLSDTSKEDVIKALNDLAWRLSQPNAAIDQSKDIRNSRNTRSRTASHSPLKAPTIARVSVKSSSQTQLAIIRPRPRNQCKPSPLSPTSSSSRKSSDTLSKLSASAARTTSSPTLSSSSAYTKFPRSRNDSLIGASNPMSINSIPQFPNTRQRHDSLIHNTSPLPPSPYTKNIVPITSQLPPSRNFSTASRTSNYTFLSDSTQLGEIPMRKWTYPFDYAEAERLNRQALEEPWPEKMIEGKGVAKRKGKGLEGVLGRLRLRGGADGGGGSVEE
ncbi:hypothetical protein GQ43DRAFT_469359 [Delitschia confertaspora ATCC 74209]|uniref:Uncharacterized protein n=1 Tax=Delitschia confertaspora ATCC 74209 TaxID=1513339 RepID=A0A9P4N1R5_9PLEO|nr:hypothetical protein GQ43DRAFT_469359 [Delitschia confertaspora ATCC 74209]